MLTLLTPILLLFNPALRAHAEVLEPDLHAYKKALRFHLRAFFKWGRGEPYRRIDIAIVIFY